MQPLCNHTNRGPTSFSPDLFRDSSWQNFSSEATWCCSFHRRTGSRDLYWSRSIRGHRMVANLFQLMEWRGHVPWLSIPPQSLHSYIYGFRAYWKQLQPYVVVYWESESMKWPAHVHNDVRIVVLNGKEISRVGRWQLLLLMSGIDSIDDGVLQWFKLLLNMCSSLLRPTL